MLKSIIQSLQSLVFLTLSTPQRSTPQIGVSATPELALEPLSQGNADTFNSMDGGHQLKLTPEIKNTLIAEKNQTYLGHQEAKGSVWKSYEREELLYQSIWRCKINIGCPPQFRTCVSHRDDEIAVY